MSRRLVLSIALLATLAPQLARADDDDVTPRYACKASPATTKISVTFRPETDLKDLVAWVVGFSCKNVVIDAAAMRYAAKVTVVSPNQMTPKQALQLFVDAVESTGLVVVQKADTLVIKLGPNTPRDCAVASSAPASGPVTISPSVPARPVEPEITVEELDRGIKKLDDTHREISRALLDRVLGNPMSAGGSARIVPNEKDGRPYGFKIFAIRADSLLGRLGFVNGDTLLTINGMDISSADKALEVYSKLRAAPRLDLQIERRGKPLTLGVTVR